MVKMFIKAHTTMLQVYYDPKETNYSALLDCFFDHVDPTTLNQQGNDRGTQYRSGIYYHNEEQKAAAEKVSACVLSNVDCAAYARHCFALVSMLVTLWRSSCGFAFYVMGFGRQELTGMCIAP